MNLARITPDEAPAAIEIERAFAPPSRAYLWALLGMLASATIFEGYDITILKLCTPYIAKAFSLSDTEVGLMAALVRFGGMLSFFVLMLADRFGRKTIISTTVLFYALFTLMTALSSGLISFTLFQSLAQIFLAAEFGIAMVIVSEEFPDKMRGSAISILQTATLVGVIVAGSLFAVVAESQFGWRGMYLIGVAPAVIVFFIRRSMRETVRFKTCREATRAADTVEIKQPLVAILREKFAPLLGPWRGRLILVSTLWNSIGMIGGPTITFFALFAKRDHGFSAGKIASATIVAYVLGSVGSLLCGLLMDQIGRRSTTCLYYLASAVSMFCLFRLSHHLTLCYIATMFAYQGARTATSAFSTELFPTEIRATGYSLTVQVLGQIGWMLSPLAVGIIAGMVHDLGLAASYFAIGPVFGALVVILFAPETGGKTLEQTTAVRSS
jgi:MFS family permease